MGHRGYLSAVEGAFGIDVDYAMLQKLALHYMFYNFARIHKTLRVTPAMQAGISDHLWTLTEIAKLAD